MSTVLMETNQHFHYLLLILLLLTTLPATTTPTSISPSPSPSTPLQPPPQQLPPQLNNIIDALIGAGDFSIWVNILSTSYPTVLPLSATLFIPRDTTTTLNNHIPIMFDPFLFPYHVIPQRLTFSDLRLCGRNTRLPTLLPGKSITVTNESAANFSLDATPITHPDLYSTPSVTVHGIAAVLDYSIFGDGIPSPPPPPPPPHKATLPRPYMPHGETIGIPWCSSNRAARAASLLCTNFRVAFLAFVLLLFQEPIF